MNSNDCKLKIKVYYKDKQFEEESKDIIPLQKIKEKAIKEFDIIKEDEDFINFTYHSNKENKNYSIEEENDIIKYCDEDSSGDLFCKFELIINNPKRTIKENILSSENKGEKIESKKSNKDINKINEKAKSDIKEDEKENYKNEINKLKLEIEKISSEFTNLKKENSEKTKEREQIINNLKEDIKNKEIEITNNKSKINSLSSMLKESKKEYETINNQKLQIESKYQHFNVDWKEFLKKTDDNYATLLNKISTLEGKIEKMKLNKSILDEYRNEKNEEKKELKENEKNKNIELIKSVIEQMKLEQNNEVIEKNKKLEEENKNLKNKIKEMENQKNTEIVKKQEKHFESIALILNEILKNIENDQKNINSIFNTFGKNKDINANKKENDNKKKSKKFSNWFKKDYSNKNENINLYKEIKNENKNLTKDIIINNNEKLQKSQDINKDFLSEFVIYDKENKIKTPSKININDLDNKDKYNNLLDQLKSFYESNISKENILEILKKIREIIILAQ